MQGRMHQAGNSHVYEVTADIVIKTEQDALDLMSNVPSDHIILRDANFEKDFFNLSSRKLGEILQKFSNYQIKVAVVGDFSSYPGKTLKDFIYESNKRGDYLFLPSVDQALARWRR